MFRYTGRVSKYIRQYSDFVVITTVYQRTRLDKYDQVLDIFHNNYSIYVTIKNYSIEVLCK